MTHIIIGIEKEVIVLLGIHEEVDDRVDCRVCHGQPEEGKEHVLGVGLRNHILRKEKNMKKEVFNHITHHREFSRTKQEKI